MCGIAGVWYKQAVTGKEISSVCLGLSRGLQHRGPDDEGFVLFTRAGDTEIYRGNDSNPGVDLPHISTAEGEYVGAMVHRRLAIITPGIKGHQPMHSEDKRYWITYNGETFNYKDLDLKYGFKNRSENDAETALNLIATQEYKTFTELDGFHAFGVFDTKNGILELYRDPTGVKPLYYVQNDNFFAFCSETKPLRLLANLIQVNHSAVYHFLAEGIFVPGEEFIDGINAVSHKLIFDCKKFVVQNFRFPLELQKPKADLTDTVLQSVKSRLMSDMPLGFAVSGGLDSAIVLGAARKLLGKDAELQVFSVVSQGDDDESRWQKKVVEYNGAQWHSTDIENAGPGLLSDVIAKVDMPAMAWNNLAHFQLARLVSSTNIKVFFNGQGADEIFGGYPDYLQRDFLRNAPFLLKNASTLPLTAAEMAKGWLKLKAKNHLPLFLLNSMDKSHAADWLGEELSAQKPYLWKQAGLGASEKMLHDYSVQKLQQMLRWEDANGMANSLESRNPFADDMQLANWLLVPFRKKIENGYTKGVLRNAVQDFVPKDVLWRVDKKGFSVPEAKLTWRCKEAWKEVFLSENLEPFSPIFKREKAYAALDVNDVTGLQWYFRLTSLSQYLEHIKSE